MYSDGIEKVIPKVGHYSGTDPDRTFAKDSNSLLLPEKLLVGPFATALSISRV
jgi:hypothetical protein